MSLNSWGWWLVLAAALALAYLWTWPRESGRAVRLDRAMDYYDEHCCHWTYFRRLVLGVLLFAGMLLAWLLRRRY